MQTRIYLAIAGMILAVMFTGCGSVGGGGTPAPPTLKSITVTPAGPSIAPFTTTQLTAWGNYSNGGTQNLTTRVTWTSSDTNIAGISASGLATAETLTGSTVITAVYSGITGSTLLTTSETVSLALSPPTPKSLAPGMTQQFSALGTLANSATQILTSWATWGSTAPDIAGVSTTGLATAGSVPGTATIFATFSGITSSVDLITSLVSSISTSPSTASIANGTSQQFTASGFLVNGTQYSDLTTYATWSSSNTVVATVSNAAGSKGLVSSHSTGTTLITAASGLIVSSPVSTLVVTPIVLTSIATSPTNTSIPDGKAMQYTAIGTFSNSSTQNITTTVTWHSSNTAVATISNTAGSKGLATSNTVGTTLITASTPSITSNSATLTITPAALVSIAVTPTSAHNIFPTSTRQFTAIGTYTDGTVVDLTDTATWATSDSAAIITSVSKGLVTVLAWGTGGTADITAEVSGITSNTATLTVSLF